MTNSTNTAAPPPAALAAKQQQHLLKQTQQRRLLLSRQRPRRRAQPDVMWARRLEWPRASGEASERVLVAHCQAAKALVQHVREAKAEG